MSKPNPPVDRAIVDWLRRLFPPRTPIPSIDSTKSVWYAAGQQRVVEAIEREYERQQE